MILSKRPGDVAASGLLPDVRETLERVDAAVLDLLDHALRVVADAVEAVRDLRVALAELHRRDLLAHDLVEQRRLRERARDGDDLVVVEIGDAVQERDDRRFLGLLRHEAEIAEPRHRFVEILNRGCHGLPRGVG